MDTALIESLQERLMRGESVAVIGGGTKAFLGGVLRDNPISMRPYAGILNYEPTELVLTACAGTPMTEIEATLHQSGQMLPFEPPVFGPESTIGGVMAAGLSGPRRLQLGSARDAILGVRLLNGLGQHLRFGGEVMKNVAGYDLSRLSVGAYGTLGILTEVSVKVLPKPETEMTQILALDAEASLARCAQLGRAPYPISAATWVDGHLYLRLSGSHRGVVAAAKHIGGELHPEAEVFWSQIRHHTHPALCRADQWLWRLSVPPLTDVRRCPPVVMDWAGGQRWLYRDPEDWTVYEQAVALGGHATCFARSRTEGTGMQPLTAGIARLNARVRDALDPHHLINQGRLSEEALHAN